MAVIGPAGCERRKLALRDRGRVVPFSGAGTVVIGWISGVGRRGGRIRGATFREQTEDPPRRGTQLRCARERLSCSQKGLHFRFRYGRDLFVYRAAGINAVVGVQVQRVLDVEVGDR